MGKHRAPSATRRRLAQAAVPLATTAVILGMTQTAQAQPRVSATLPDCDTKGTPLGVGEDVAHLTGKDAGQACDWAAQSVNRGMDRAQSVQKAPGVTEPVRVSPQAPTAPQMAPGSALGGAGAVSPLLAPGVASAPGAGAGVLGPLGSLTGGGLGGGLL